MALDPLAVEDLHLRDAVTASTHPVRKSDEIVIVIMTARADGIAIALAALTTGM